MRILLASFVVAAACASPKPSAPTAKPRSYPAPLYAGLFVKGARHEYTVESTREYADDQDPRADSYGNVEERFTGAMTCTVTEVHVLPSAIASRIECAVSIGDAMVGDGPAGIYVATADGLWSVPAIPRVAPTDPRHRLFTWPPVAGQTEERDPANPGWGTTISISRDAVGGWCRYFTFVSGDEGDATICVRDGIVVAGSSSSAGAASYATSYELATK